MKKITNIVAIACLLLFSTTQNSTAQGFVTAVTPDSSQLGTTVSLQISGTNTLFSQATTSLHSSISGYDIYATSFSIANDSSMFATFDIPNDVNYLGLWDVNAGLANPLLNGFTISYGVLVQGNIFHDLNANCIMDGGEVNVNYGYVMGSPGSVYAPVYATGNYQINFPVGTYNANLTYHPPYPGYQTITCPANDSITIPIATSTPIIISNQNFGVEMDTCVHLQTSVWTNAMRPCFDHGTQIYVSNNSPAADPNVTVTITYDSFHNIHSSTPAWTSNVANVLTFHVAVNPFGYALISIYDSIPCSAVLGTQSCITAVAVPSISSCSFGSTGTGCRNFSNSYDPNEKLVNSPTSANISPTDELSYTIGFQNTGTDTAFNIVVLDTLSYYLNPASLLPFASSHPFTYTLLGGHVAKFTFNNILLPDSTTNEVQSHGFVSYTIEQNPNNQPGSVIENTGAIFFDFNLPVFTNTTMNMIPLAIGIDEVNFNSGDVRVYPNPFSSSTRFVFENKNPNSKCTLTIHDITGRLVKEIKNITGNYYDFESTNLNSEMYFYKVMDEEKQLGVGKIIIQK